MDPLKSLWNQKTREDNQCGVKGVYKADGKWIARINVNKKHIILGRFATLEEAKTAREADEAEYFGDLSYERSIAVVPRIEGIPWKEPIERFTASSDADPDAGDADAAVIDPAADPAAVPATPS